MIDRPGKAISFTAYLFCLAIGAVWLYVPPAGGWRFGVLAGALMGTGIAFSAFFWKLSSLTRSGNAFLAGMVGGFLMNLAFLVGGTILARYSSWLGNYQGFAFGYLGAAFISGGPLTWALRHGGRVPVDKKMDPSEEDMAQ